MCNLYSVDVSEAEIADFFGVKSQGRPQANMAEDIVPGYPGLVVREQEGERVLDPMVWGFPLRLKSMRPGSKPKAVNNIADIRKGMWVGLARKPQWRCLAPVARFAEAEGVEGRKTRTWFMVRGEPLFAWACLWRNSDEWGRVYSCVMTNANAAIAPVHTRMPVLLHRDEWDVWLRGTFDECCALQDRVFPEHLIEMNRTTELWSRTSKAAKAQGSLF